MTTLLASYDAVLFDLDGTLFVGQQPLAGAVETVDDVRRGHRIGYLTNNSSRRPGQVARHLSELGFTATDQEVVTSGQAAARVLRDRLPAAASVLVVGTDGLAGEITDVGLSVTDRADAADAVVQGHSFEQTWRVLAEACLAIRGGALWVACNVDSTLPTERGEVPGNGALVAALRVATGREPTVAGKPEPMLFTEATRRLGAGRALVVGDRLETDIAGAVTAGLPSLLVLTGVSDAHAVLAAPEDHRPTHLGADLGALYEDVERTRPGPSASWSVRGDGRELVLGHDGDHAPDGSPVVALRALCDVHWRRGGGPARVRAGDERAATTLRTLGLSSPPERAGVG